MGCGSSRGVVVPSDSNLKNSTASVNGKQKKLFAKESIPSDTRMVAGTDLDAETLSKKREISATSTRTTDSGISEFCEGDVIAEHSNETSTEVKDCEEGVTRQRSESGKVRGRLELQKKKSESNVPKLPPVSSNDSLLERPQTRGGVAFDITFCPETGNIKKAPPNLPKLEQRKRKKKLTKEELEEKMRKAGERREEHNKKIVEKSHAFLQQYENVVQRRNNVETLSKALKS